MSHVNVALIGYAFMGRAHSNAYRQVTPFFSPRLTPRMRVLCGRTRPAVDRAARQLGWEETSTDWREVIERRDIDLVDISTPGDSHAEIAIAAARAGKAVLCEKPLANTVREAEAMLDAVGRTGVVHMVCHNYRRAPAVMLAQHLIADGQLGEIRHFRGTYLQDWINDPSFPLVWRLDRKRAGSGALGDIGAHVIDLARFLVGEIVEVAGDLRTFIRERPLPKAKGGPGLQTGPRRSARESPSAQTGPRQLGRVTVDDAATALVRFAGGAMGTIEATRLAPGRKNYNRFEINGSKGSVAFDLERMNELELYLEADRRSLRGFRTILVTEADHPFVKAWWPPGHIIGYEHTFTHTVFDLLEAMADERVPAPNFADGVRNQKVMDAIDRAAKSRKWVDT
jgi:predicted dehydrogenase